MPRVRQYTIFLLPAAPCCSPPGLHDDEALDLHRGRERPRLRPGPRKAVEEAAARDHVGLREALSHEADHDLVGDETSPVQVAYQLENQTMPSCSFRKQNDNYKNGYGS